MRFGEYLVHNDKVRIGQLVEALKIQVENEISALYEAYNKEK